MEKIDSILQSRLETRPQQTVRLIVRVKGDLTVATARLAELGATVLHSFQLTNAVAVACSGQTALALLREPWVQTIEQDRQITIQKPSRPKKGEQR